MGSSPVAPTDLVCVLLVGLCRECDDGGVSDYSVVETAEGLRIVSDDNSVDRLSVDYSFSLHLGTDIVVSIAEPFMLFSEDGNGVVVPSGEPFEVEAALPLFGDRVERLFAAESGELHISFATGKRIEVAAGRPYENWQIYFPNGGWWVGLPGGGLSTYSPPADRTPDVHQSGSRWHPPEQSPPED